MIKELSLGNEATDREDIGQKHWKVSLNDLGTAHCFR